MANNYNDSYKLRGLRKKLIAILKKKGIEDLSVLDAISKIPRHIFLGSSALAEKSYQDIALPIGGDQTISQPYTVAFQSELLRIKPRIKVLEIGTGSGYQAAVLHEMGARVYSIERNEMLYKRTKKLLQDTLSYKIRLKLGDGTKGWDLQAPFDRIIVTAAAPEIPEPLVEQLAPNGLMVVPVGDRETQKMILITKDENESISEKVFDEFKFVPLIGKYAWKE